MDTRNGPHNGSDANPPARGLPKLWQGPLLLAAVIALLIFVFSYAQAYWGLWGMVLTQAGIAAVTLLFVFIFKADIKAVFPLNRIRGRYVPGALLTWLGAYLITLGVTIFLMLLFPNMVSENAEITEFVAQDSLWLRVLAAAILPGICEEMMHRGFILAGSGRIKRVWVRVLYMGAIFAVFHIYPFRYVTTAILGFALSYIMIRTQNIILPMICHAFNNFLAVMATLAMDSGAVDTQTAVDAAAQISVSQGLLLAGMGIVPLAAGWALLRDSSRKLKAAPLIVAALTSAALFAGGVVWTLRAPIYDGALTYSVSDAASFEESFSIRFDYPMYAYEFECRSEHYLCEAVLVGPAGAEAVRFGPGAGFNESGTLELAGGEYTMRVSFMPRETGAPPEEVEISLKITLF